MRAAVAFALLACGVLFAACGSNRRMFVQSISLDGRQLVVTKCPLAYPEDAPRRDAGCTTETFQVPTPQERR